MRIHLLSTKKARAQLSTEMNADGQARYWLASVLLATAYGYQSGLIGFRLEWTLLIDLAVSIAIVCIGISECYQANGKTSGRDFILRLAVLGVPLGIWLWLVTFVLYGINWYGFPYFMRMGLFASPERAWHFLTFFLWNGTLAIFWWRMHYHIKVLNRIIHQSASVTSEKSNA
jgi:hypothetical protein